MIFKDTICPETEPYNKKGGDKKCYACPDTRMELVNKSPNMHENSKVITGDKACLEIDTYNAMYGFDKSKGQINQVCALCIKTKSGYFLDNGITKKCIEGIPNCLECANSSTCTLCGTGFSVFDTDNDPSST